MITQAPGWRLFTAGPDGGLTLQAHSYPILERSQTPTSAKGQRGQVHQPSKHMLYYSRSPVPGSGPHVLVNTSCPPCCRSSHHSTPGILRGPVAECRSPSKGFRLRPGPKPESLSWDIQRTLYDNSGPQGGFLRQAPTAD